jgi:hypothetical protein
MAEDPESGTRLTAVEIHENIRRPAEKESGSSRRADSNDDEIEDLGAW